METGRIIVVRGGGDIATGTICRLHHCGYRVLVLEVEEPLSIRRTVSLSQAVFAGSHQVEGVTAKRIEQLDDCTSVWDRAMVPVLIDPTAMCLESLSPYGLVDGILAKRNLGTTIDMAKVTIGLGPGFTAGRDVHAVIETARGHDLGRVLYKGTALPDTGVPGAIDGYSWERVLYAPHDGVLAITRDIGSTVKAGEAIAAIDTTAVIAPIDGVVRGMLPNRSKVRHGTKIADIDPREGSRAHCWTISDKARCISGGVLEALLSFPGKGSR